MTALTSDGQPAVEAPPVLRFCVQCRHYEDVGSAMQTVHGCGYHEKIDLVDGKKVFRRCWEMRAEKGECGQDGKLWEARA